MAEKSANYGPDLMRMAEKSLLLQLLDQTWKDHLLSLDHLRQGINLRAYAQRDPLNEYKREAFELFEAMLANLRQHITSVLRMSSCGCSSRPSQWPAASPRRRWPRRRSPPARPAARSRRRAPSAAPAPATAPTRGGPRPAGPRAPWAGTPRNAPCPCGSGKKFKHCHGRV